MNPILLVQLMLVHFVSDFLMQSNYMAVNKSKNIDVLNLHSFVYALPFFVFLNIPFVSYLYATHFFIDLVTSKITSYLWNKEERHYFFCVIGADQFLHFLVILAGIYLCNIK